MIYVLVITMVLLLILGFPLLITLLVGPLIVFFVYYPDLDKIIFIQQMVSGVKPQVLIAIPLFIFAAEIMTAGQSAKILIDLVMSFVRHVRGGLAMTTSVSCTLFGSISGSTQATVVAVGGAMRPALRKGGYSSPFSTALIINSSDIAFLIPPSAGMIVYGVIAKNTSVAELFIAGIGPGLLITVLFCIYSYIHARIAKIPIQKKATWAERRWMLKRALLTLLYPVIIIGGIYSGIFSPVEAAAMSVFYAFILEFFIYRAITLNKLYKMALSAGVVTAVVFIIMAAGFIFSWTITFAKIPQPIVAGLFGTDPSQLRILITICIVFFIGCMFVDPLVILIVLVPIFHPIAVNAGIDPVFVGVIVILQAALGSATPPFGCDIFTAVAIFRRPYYEIVKGTPPFIFILLVATAMLILFPQISLFLRDLAFR